MPKTITVTKNKLSIKDLVFEDSVLGEYFSQFKGDEEALGAAVHRALRIGVMALQDERLSTLIGKIEKDRAENYPLIFI